MKHLLFGLIAIGSFGSSMAATTNYMTCEDGSTLRVIYPTDEFAVLDKNNQLHLLKIAVSASGARYIGNDLQWWTKGNEGNLSVLKDGESYAKDQGINCQLDTKTNNQTKKQN